MTRVAFLLLLLAGCAGPATTTAPRRPNIVLLVSDDQGYAEMSCQGGDLPTPHLDALAASGIRYRSGYVVSPYCSPSRAGLLTGRYPQRFGHEINPVERTNDLPHVGLPVGEKTIADHLRAGGYVTGMVGKWHLGNHPPYYPTARGFDEFFGFLREGHSYLPLDRSVNHLRAREPEYDRLNPMLRGESEVGEKEYLTSAFAREATSFIDRHAARPFFLYVPFNAPHSPMQAAPEDHARFAHIADPHRRVWAAMMKALDDAVGRILDALRRRGLEKDTLVCFLSDNGGPTKELTSRNNPYSGGKGSLREGGVRVPFILSWPGRIRPGVWDGTVSALDLLPTVLDAAGLPEPPGLDGVTLLGPRHHDRTVFWRMAGKLAIRDGRWKLLSEPAGAPFALFDLLEDPAESKDLAAVHPEVVRDLEAKLRDWEKGLIPPRWTN
ncbi:MAG TPA: sulfatase-like hydrolase/transferase [Planctomycetota bacterium]